VYAADPEPRPAAPVTAIQLSVDTAVQSQPVWVEISATKLPPDAGALWDAGCTAAWHAAMPDGPTLPPAKSAAGPQPAMYTSSEPAAMVMASRRRMAVLRRLTGPLLD
jgi:hypothetical protein